MEKMNNKINNKNCKSYPGKAILLPFRFFQKTGRVSSNLRKMNNKMNNKTITQKSPKTSES